VGWGARVLCRAVAVITDKRQRKNLKELVKVIQQCEYMYSDPITQFLTSLYVEFDFEAAQQKLRDCEALFANDFFIMASQEEFVNNARQFIFEVYCRIHQCIDVKMLASQLNMEASDAERWYAPQRCYSMFAVCAAAPARIVPMLSLVKLKLSTAYHARLVNLVREARLDAKIDAESNQVLMTPHQPDVYQQVIDKTKSLAFRSYVLSKQLEGRQ
jgi:translation initiation factor 3 subunit E